MTGLSPTSPPGEGPIDNGGTAALKPRRRFVLSAVLAVIALLLIVGGAQLALLGGSFYYLAVLFGSRFLQDFAISISPS